MKKRNYLALAAFAAIVAGCSNNDEIVTQDNLKDTPITIASAGVAELTTRSAETTPLEGTTDTPATMSVFITGGSETKYNADNVKWTHDGTGWTNKGTMMLYEGTGSSQQIYACSPYAEEITDNNVTVTADVTTDWLVATEASLTGSSVSLAMTHALTKLVLIPSYGTEITDQTITSIEVGGMYSSGKLNIFDNTWSGLPETADATLSMTDNELLVIPMTYCESFPITVTMAGPRTFKATISLAGVSNMLAAGTQYNIKLQIGKDKVTLGEITASPWPSQNGGELATE